MGSSLTNESISVCIPCFNGAHYLKETIPSILALQGPIKEVIVVDDGSTDDTFAIASSFPVKVIRHQENKGLAAARNSAIKYSTGSLIAAIDADVSPDPYWALPLIDEIAAGKTAVGGMLREKFTSTLADKWRERMMPQHHGEHRVEQVKLFGCNSLIRKDALQAIGGYDEQYRFSYEDMDLSERLINAGYTTLYTPTSLCWHLRKDTPQSVLDTCYRWRLPGYNKAGAFDCLQRVASKWILSASFDIQDARNLMQEGRGQLSVLTLLGLVRGFLKDLRSFKEKGGILPLEVERSCVYALIGALSLFPFTSALIERVLFQALSPLIHREIFPSGVIDRSLFEHISSMMKGKELVEEVFSFFPHLITPESILFVYALQEFVFKLPRDKVFWEGIEQGINQIVHFVWS